MLWPLLHHLKLNMHPCSIWSIMSDSLRSLGSMDPSPLGFSDHGLSQARIPEWMAISSPGDLSDPGIEPVSLVSPSLAGGFFTTSVTDIFVHF